MNKTRDEWLSFQQGERADLLDEYREKGYLVFDDLLQPEEIEQILTEFNSLLERFARLDDGISEFKAPSGDGVVNGPQLRSLRSEAFIQFENNVDPPIACERIANRPGADNGGRTGTDFTRRRRPLRARSRRRTSPCTCSRHSPP